MNEFLKGKSEKDPDKGDELDQTVISGRESDDQTVIVDDRTVILDDRTVIVDETIIADDKTIIGGAGAVSSSTGGAQSPEDTQLSRQSRQRANIADSMRQEAGPKLIELYRDAETGVSAPVNKERLASTEKIELVEKPEIEPAKVIERRDYSHEEPQRASSADRAQTAAKNRLVGQQKSSARMLIIIAASLVAAGIAVAVGLAFLLR